MNIYKIQTIKRGRIAISDVYIWKNEISENTNSHLTDPSISQLIDSVLLPDIHTDPLDSLLIAQANQNNFLIVTKDLDIQKYDVKTFWI